MTRESIAAHDRSATGYDAAASAAGWFPEALFGLCADRIRPGERVLALGIGTGQCAAPFAAHGLTVWGVDESTGMLAVCRAKGIAQRLVEHDLAVVPWPFADGAVTHVLASGVTHFVPDLASFVAQSRRVMSPDGVLALTTRLPRSASPAGGGGVERIVVDGVATYSHPPGLLTEVLTACRLAAVKQLDVLLSAGEARDVYRLTVAVPS